MQQLFRYNGIGVHILIDCFVGCRVVRGRALRFNLLLLSSKSLPAGKAGISTSIPNPGGLLYSI